jgi:hypothetical protein
MGIEAEEAAATDMTFSLNGRVIKEGRKHKCSLSKNQFESQKS